MSVPRRGEGPRCGAAGKGGGRTPNSAGGLIAARLRQPVDNLAHSPTTYHLSLTTMSLIVRDLRLEVGPRVLLEGASFTVHGGDKIGLVGRNGAGKTTLLRTLVGYQPPAAGAVLRTGDLGYFSQEAALPDLEHPDANALERILTARDIGSLQRRMEETRRKIEKLEGTARDRAIVRFARLQDEFEARGGFPAEAEAKQVAASLGIGTVELSQPVRTMSGGQRRRVELARILFAETDILLLDEPTNHLDLDAKAWLVQFLAAYRGGLLVVSHDLPLLDESITSVLAARRRRCRDLPRHLFGVSHRTRQASRPAHPGAASPGSEDRPAGGDDPEVPGDHRDDGAQGAHHADEGRSSQAGTGGSGSGGKTCSGAVPPARAFGSHPDARRGSR